MREISEHKNAPQGNRHLTKYGQSSALETRQVVAWIQWPGSALTGMQFRANIGRRTQVIFAGTGPRRSVEL